MHLRNLALTLVLVLCLGAFLPGQVASGAVNWLTLESDRTTIFYGRGYEADARQVLAWLQEALETNERVLGVGLKGRAMIYLNPDLRTHGRGEGDAWADMDSATIWMLTPSAMQHQDIRDNFRKVLTHEINHAIVGQLRPHATTKEGPQWFIEGLAEYVATLGAENSDMGRQALHYAQQDLRTAALRGELNGFSVGDMYKRGPYVLAFLYDTFSREQMLRLIQTNSGDMMADIKQVLGVTQGDLRNAWFRWVSSQFEIPLKTITGNPADGGVATVQKPKVTVERRYFRLEPPAAPVSVSMKIGVAEYEQQGDRRPMEVAPRVLAGRTMVPLRSAVEALGASVAWEAATQSIAVKLEGPPAKERAKPIYVPTQFVVPSCCNEENSLIMRAKGVQAIPLEELQLILDAPLSQLIQWNMWSAEEIKRVWGQEWFGSIDIEVLLVQESPGVWRTKYPLTIRQDSRVIFDMRQPDHNFSPAIWSDQPLPKP